jgi:hypothetical protein
MKSKLSLALVICLSVQILGVLLFCVGFFPQRVPLKGYNTHESLPPDFVTVLSRLKSNLIISGTKGSTPG